MGYDIHCYLEVKTVNDVWHAYGKSFTRINQNYTTIPVYQRIFVARDYGIFSVLSGIRNDSKPVLFPVPRGLPLDLSNELKITFDSIEEEWNKWNGQSYITIGDAGEHETSYVTYEELNEFADKYPLVHGEIQRFKNAISNDLKGLCAEYDAHPDITWDTILDARKRVVFFYGK